MKPTETVDEEIHRATSGLVKLRTLGDSTLVLEKLGRDARKVLSRRIWSEEVIPSWNTMRTSNKIDRLVWYGIPPSLRGKVWQMIVGNELKITRELFEILQSRAEQVETNSDYRLIEQDVPRTFPTLQFFHCEGPLRQPLEKLLKAYVHYRPDIGYVQGMSYIASVLLLNMDSVEGAFCAFSNLVNTDFYFPLYRKDSVEFNGRISVLEKLIKWHLPQLYVHLNNQGVSLSSFLWEWMITLFSKSLALDVVMRIWDNVLYRGHVFTFQIVLGVFSCLESQLLSSEFEGCVHLLQNLPLIDEDDLFKAIQKHSVSSKTLQNILDAHKSSI